MWLLVGVLVLLAVVTGVLGTLLKSAAVTLVTALALGLVAVILMRLRVLVGGEDVDA